MKICKALLGFQIPLREHELYLGKRIAQYYPGYQRFFLACYEELCRPRAKTRAAKPETAHEKPLAPRVAQYGLNQ